MMFERLYSFSLLAEGAAAPPLQFKIDTLLFSLIIFLVLLFVLFRFAWKPIMEGLDKRERSIKDEIDSARQANEQAQANLKQYEDKLASVTAEATAILAEAKQDALSSKERILAEANEEARRKLDKALAEIDSAKDQAVRELAEHSVNSAVSLAGNIVGRSLQKSDHAKLIEESIQKFSNGA